MSLSRYSTFARRVSRLSAVIAIAGAAALSSPQMAEAQSIPRRWQANYQPPSGIGAPRRTEGGASRGPEDDIALTALVPRSNDFGVTTVSHPTIFAYMPASSSPAAASIVEFELIDAQGRSVYFTELEPVETAGILGLRLPSTTPGLAVNQGYRWVITVYDRFDEPIGQVNGLIQRVPLPAALAAATSASAYDQALLYAEAGLWYDALAAMATAYRSNPTAAVREGWTRLLDSAELEELAQATVLNDRIIAQP